MPRVRAYIRRVSKDDDEIADLLAETRALAWLGRAELLADPTPTPVMIQFARQACREWMVRRRLKTRLDDVTAAMTPTQDAAADSMSVEEAEEWQRWCVRALSRLSVKQRLAVEYRYRWSWAYEFVEATARVHAHRGLGRLRTSVAHDPPPPLESDRHQVIGPGTSSRSVIAGRL
jgi:DNA-directed RNA polymerase specialized sigma24 family protein